MCSKLVSTEVNFNIKYYQFLSPKGEIINLNNAESNPKKIPSLINNSSHLEELYKAMVLARIFDNKAVALQRTGRMGTYPSILGQEAVSIAMADSLTDDDVYVPYYRDVSGMLLRGVKMEEIMLYWGGDERGSDYQNQKKDFPICVPIATQCLHAAGVATAFKYRKQKNVCITAIGDGGTSKGDFYEAMNLAGTWKLPVVFVVNNNQWAISVPRNKQTATKTIAQKGIAAGINSVQVDGNDIIAMQHIVNKAVQDARANKGPTLIEAISYRLGDHTTADDASRYRKQQEVDDAKQKDPITRLHKYMCNNNLWNSDKEEKLQNQCSLQVNKAVENYLNTKPQPAESMFDHLYANLPEIYQPQRQMAKTNSKQEETIV